MAEVAAIVLAAGRGSRFGAGASDSKVLARHQGLALINHVVAAVQTSRAKLIVVVTGHADEAVASSLAGLDVMIVHNQTFNLGIASSLRVGVAALPSIVDGVLILLGDMPLVATVTLDALIDAFERGDTDAVVPMFEGKRGNPVLIGRALFSSIMRLEGDQGARRLLKDSRSVRTLDVEDPGIVVDIDTPEALRDLGIP